MKKIIFALCCMLVVGVSEHSFAANLPGTYKGTAYAVGKANLGKMGIYPTDVIVINNTPDTLTISAPGIYRDYISGNGVYRLTSNSTVSPEIILRHYAYGVVYDNYVQPHSIISFSIQQGTAHTLSVEYY